MILNRDDLIIPKVNTTNMTKNVIDPNFYSKFYSDYGQKVSEIRQKIGRPLTYAEKVLYAHVHAESNGVIFNRGKDYGMFQPDRVAMQDATAQMALLQFMNAGRKQVAVPTTVHCDHLICADQGAKTDLAAACSVNREVYDFLQSVSNHYGISFWKPGAGIIHQIVLENYAFPGGMMIGTDSHTPNSGGLGMMGIGVGGADAVDVMAGLGWELKFPRLIGVKLTGKLQGWSSPKDVILKLAGMLTTKGGTNCVIEYFGPGASTLSATGKATICNMGAEVGATCSLFPYDENIKSYLQATGRDAIAASAATVAKDLQADSEVYEEPEKYYDVLYQIDLSSLEPYINGPFTPDAANPVSEFSKIVKERQYPEKVEVALIGSCTNSSYQDLYRAASVAREAAKLGIKPAAQLIINPGSEQIRQTAERDGLLDDFKKIGAIIMANACGPCIGQWRRHTDDAARKNSIVTTFNRNFAKRADGNPNTHAFIVSPEMAVAYALSGSLLFNPNTDSLLSADGNAVKLPFPQNCDLPVKGFKHDEIGEPSAGQAGDDIKIASDSQRLQLLKPFGENHASDFEQLRLLIKVTGKCTTDHISMAGPWLKYRGHLDHISDNLLMGATNVFDGLTNSVINVLNNQYDKVSAVARCYKEKGWGSVVVAEENYGEGSSREHAAMEPRYLNVKVILAKSFARIHETNLKKQGVLALTFSCKDDYEKVRETDVFSVEGLENFTPDSQLTVILHHADGTSDRIPVQHTYNQQQINWFKAGSALNYLRKCQA